MTRRKQHDPTPPLREQIDDLSDEMDLDRQLIELTNEDQLERQLADLADLVEGQDDDNDQTPDGD